MSAVPDALWAAAIRWLGLSALAGILGGTVLDLLVLPRNAPELVRVRARLRRLNLSCLAALVAASAGELVGRAHTMGGGGWAEAFRILPLVLTRTHFGTIWSARIVGLGLIVAVFRLSGLGPLLLGLFLLTGVALTTSLVGHAADWGDASVAAAVDWVHLIAAGAWTGGLGGLALAVLADRATWPQALFERVTRRFSRLAGVCVTVVVLTGSYNAWVQVRSPAALWTTPYGRVLLLKLVIVLGLLGLGATNRYALLPRLSSRGSSPLGADKAVQSRLASNIAREVLLALIVLGCTAILGETTPGRHARHLRHPEAVHHAEQKPSGPAPEAAR